MVYYKVARLHLNPLASQKGNRYNNVEFCSVIVCKIRKIGGTGFGPSNF